MFCDCSVTAVGGEQLPSPSINNVVVSPAFSHLLLFSVACLSSLPFASTMGKNNKRKREPTPPLEDFGDSEYSEKEFSSESEGSPAPIPLRESSDDSDDSQGLAAEVWTYIRAIERFRLEGSNESEYSSDEEDSDGGGEDEDGGGEDEDGGGEDEDGNDDDDEGGGGGDGDGSGRVHFTLRHPNPRRRKSRWSSHWSPIPDKRGHHRPSSCSTSSSPSSFPSCRRPYHYH
jgi:hypothetical protein